MKNLNIKKTRLPLNEYDREVMYVMLSSGKEIPAIAKRLRRNRTVISRDLKRNAGNSPWWDSLSPVGKGREAHRRAKQRARKSRKKKRLKNKWIRKVVYSMIEDSRWSPELISGYLRAFHPRLYVCTESIYLWIANDEPDLKEFLVCGGKKYRNNRVKYKRPPKDAAADKKHISERSDVANTREEFGHYEGDAIVSKKSKVSIINTVERQTRYMFTEKIQDCTGKSGKKAFIDTLSKIPEPLRKSLTLDNGSENSLHAEIEIELGIDTYFCTPYHAFEKGTVENRNKFLRIFFPKGTDLASVPLYELKRVTELHNNRPIKKLGFRTPNQMYQEVLKEYRETLH
jgi:Transposase and inactivated derivatives, IS30 family